MSGGHILALITMELDQIRIAIETGVCIAGAALAYTIGKDIYRWLKDRRQRKRKKKTRELIYD